MIHFVPTELTDQFHGALCHCAQRLLHGCQRDADIPRDPQAQMCCRSVDRQGYRIVAREMAAPHGRRNRPSRTRLPSRTARPGARSWTQLVRDQPRFARRSDPRPVGAHRRQTYDWTLIYRFRVCSDGRDARTSRWRPGRGPSSCRNDSDRLSAESRNLPHFPRSSVLRRAPDDADRRHAALDEGNRCIDKGSRNRPTIRDVTAD